MFRCQDFLWSAPALILSMAMASCGPKIHGRDSTLAAEQNSWAKKAWVTKVARVIKGGDGLAPTDDLDALAATSPVDVVTQLMADPRFADTVLDFNLYFLGFKPVRLSQLNTLTHSLDYDVMVYSKPQAIASAQAIMKDQDYFTLFDNKQTMFIGPILDYVGDDESSDPTPVKRARKLTQIHHAFATMMSKFNTPSAGAPLNRAGGCAALDDESNGLDRVGVLFGDALLTGYLTVEVSFQRGVRIRLMCRNPSVTAETILAALSQYKMSLTSIFAAAASLTEDRYEVQSPADIKGLDTAPLGLSDASDQFTLQGFWVPLQNSSTNYNRKRAAYVLKTYFCDDLTPVRISLPAAHAEGKHASDPSCQACHYKLDPMAGFFRNRGIFGADMAKTASLLFDDQVTLTGDKLNNYMNSWKAPAGSGRAWNIGYVRSATDDVRNTYGENLDDLFVIVRSAKETRQCLVRRMAEYYIGGSQVFDSGWLDSLAAKFDNEPNTSKAYKAIVTDLVTSKSFMTPNPDPNKCYDFVPGQAATGVPCEVAMTLKNNCASCHHSTLGAGRLDLSSWITLADTSQSFPHLSSDGNQKSRKETFTALADRLSTNDESLLMPLGHFMSPGDRARLYKWVDRILSARGENP